MKKYRFEILFAVLVGARACSFVINKVILENMGTMTLIANRFLLTSILLFVLMPKRILRMNRASLLGGLAVGVTFFLMAYCEFSAVKTADSSLVSIVEHVSIILVPLVEAVLVKKLPTAGTMIGAALAFAGIACIGFQYGTLSGSIGLSLLAAVLYTACIIVTDRVTTEEADPLVIGFVQLLTMGSLALVFALTTEHFTIPHGVSQWWMILFLVVVCSAFGFTLTPYAQSHISVERAGILCAVNPAVAAILGAVILHERLGVLGYIGLFLVLGSIIIPYLKKD